MQIWRLVTGTTMKGGGSGLPSGARPDEQMPLASTPDASSVVLRQADGSVEI
jgi:hypothetical protein